MLFVCGYGDKTFFSVLKPLKWLTKFKEWKYRSQVTNCIKKSHQLSWKFFFECMSSEDSLTFWRKWTGKHFFFYLRLSPRWTWWSCKTELEQGTDFSARPLSSCIGAQPFPPCPTSSISSSPKNQCHQNKALRLLWPNKSLVLSRHPKESHLGYAGCNLRMPSNEHSHQLRRAFDCYQSSICERFSLSLTVPWVIQFFYFVFGPIKGWCM